MEAQLRNNGKKFYPIKKLVIGIILLSSFFMLNSYFGVDGIYSINTNLENKFSEFMSKNLSIIFSALICLPIPVFMVYAAVSGTYRVFTFNMYNPVFEENTPGGVPVKGSEFYPNINRVLSYRESKMCAMSSERSAELYISSSKIESLYTGYNSGPETRRTLSYIESKLSGMSSDRGLNYLANKL